MRRDVRRPALGAHLIGRPAEGERLRLRDELAMNRSWWSAIGSSGCGQPIKSHGTRVVPWWMSW